MVRTKGEAGTGDIVEATKHYTDPLVIAEASKGLGGAMHGLAVTAMEDKERLAVRGV